MKFTPQSPLAMLCLFFSITFFFSCSKDSDLMADYVALDPEVLIGKYVRSDTFQVSIISNSEDETFEITVNSGSGDTENSGSGGTSSGENAGTTVNDTYETSSSAGIVLDVLANDTFINKEEVVISETSQPANGEVVINSDNTLTYTPYTIDETEDTFTYTVEFVKEDGTIGKETGTVTVTVNGGSNKLGELLAFPGAVGHGRNATGGRGGDVYEVTNLNGSGVGSFKYGLDQAPPEGRTIVFKVSGWINRPTSGYTSVSKDNITIAGQTAPGGGIGLRGELRIRASNIIVRHMNIRSDSNWLNGEAAVRILGDGFSVEDIIIDHVSLGWAKDENITISSTTNQYNVKGVTFQNCIIDNNLYTGYAVMNYRNPINISYYQNLFAYHGSRVTASSTSGPASIEFINNMVYSYKSGFSIKYGQDFDFIGNVYDTGGYTLPSYGDQFVDFVHALETNSVEIGKTDPGPSGSFCYFSDNIAIGFTSQYGSNARARLQPSRVNPSNIVPYPAVDVRDNVLANAGAYNGLSQGMNAFDLDIINNVENDLRGSRLTSRIFPTDFPTLASGTPYTDTDFDGMSDSWETARGLDPGITDNNGDDNSDGYTNLEEFLHSLTQ